MSDDFFRNLPPVDVFSRLTDPRNYESLPEDWCIAVADIRNSTLATKNGQFKAVNISAASLIAAFCNQFPNLDIPYQFNGDGVVIAFPKRIRPEAAKLCNHCSSLIKHVFGLEMISGVISVSDPELKNHPTKAARYLTSDNVSQAAFIGSGVEKAEILIRDRYNESDYSSWENHSKVDLTGLECRWSQFPADEQALCLIISAGEQYSNYREVFQLFSASGMELINPVKESDLDLTFRLKELSYESRIRSGSTGFQHLKVLTKILLQQIAGLLLMRFGIKTKETEWELYKPDFILNSDYKKFGNRLRMIIGGKKSDHDKLLSDLERLYREGKICYGASVSEATVSTCYVTRYHRNHIHFIDGADGGYTRASIDFKKRFKADRNIPVRE